MLRNQDLAVILPADPKLLDRLDAGICAFGLQSGVRYGRAQRLERADRDGQLMFFWESSPRICAQTPFLGQLPTAQNVYAARVSAALNVQDPAAVRRHPSWVQDHQAQRLTLERLASPFAERVQAALGRLACRYSPQALVGGPAQEAGRAELAAELARIYRPEGIHLVDLCLEDVSAELRRWDLWLAWLRIQKDGREQARALQDDPAEQQRALEESFQHTLRRLEEAPADATARQLAARLKKLGSYQQLAKQAAGVAAPPAAADGNGGPIVLATEPVLLGGRDRPAGRFAVLSANDSPVYYEILRPWLFLGRDPHCDVQLPSGGVSALHATFAQVGSGLLVLDHASRYGTFFESRRVAQRFLEAGDALQMGDSWIVLKLEPGQEFQPIDRSFRESTHTGFAPAGGTLPPQQGPPAQSSPGTPTPRTNAAQAMVQLVCSTGDTASSDARPIFVGRDSSCSLCLPAAGVGRFHAVVSWGVELDPQGRITRAGVYLEDLNSGRGTIVNHTPAVRTRLAERDLIEIAGYRITVSLLGDAQAHARALFEAEHEPLARDLALTCIEGPLLGHEIRLGAGQSELLLGRGPDVELELSCDLLSRRHARFRRTRTASPDGLLLIEFDLTDLGSTNGTSVNRTRLQPDRPHRLTRGDIVRFGRSQDACDFLVHEAF